MNLADRLVRTRVYLGPEHLAKCKVLADRYHTNRSEVIRVALNHGLGLVAKDLKRPSACALGSCRGAAGFACTLWGSADHCGSERTVAAVRRDSSGS